MPTLTMLRMGLPVKPFHRPLRTSALNVAIRCSTSWTSGTTLRPATRITASAGARNATCSAARFSVTFTTSPRNIAAARSSTRRRAASASRRSSVSLVTRCFE